MFLTELLVGPPPRPRLLDCITALLAVANHACSAKRETSRIGSVELNEADPLIGISLADLRPRKRLGDHGRMVFFGRHRSTLDDPHMDRKLLPILKLRGRYYSIAARLGDARICMRRSWTSHAAVRCSPSCRSAASIQRASGCSVPL